MKLQPSFGIAFATGIVGAIFASAGDPALRHDWLPISADPAATLNSFSGWNPVGLGSPVSYPASFALVIVLSCLAFVFGSYAIHVLYMLGIFITIALGARRLGQRLAASGTMQCAMAVFASFNPWTYTKLVSGHTSMLLAYGATFWLVAELFARRPSVRALVVTAFLAAPQIQFLVCDFFLFVFLAFRLRDPRPLLAIGAAALPVAVGLITSGKSLLGIPLTLEWEVSQSLYPLQGVFLRGYFTGYDERLDPYLIWTLFPIIALATVGALYVIFRDRRLVWAVALTTFLLLVTFGTRGPLKFPFEFAVDHVAVIGLFREIYDLTGFVAIGYCILLSRSRRPQRPWLTLPLPRHWGCRSSGFRIRPGATGSMPASCRLPM